VTVLRNNYTSGPDGTTFTLAASGANEDDAFDTFNKSADSNVILKYKTAAGLDRPTADYVLRMSTGAVTGSTYTAWSTSMGAQSQFWIRFYCYFSVAPDTFASPLIFQAVDTVGGSRCNLGIMGDTGPHLLFTENAAGTVYTATSAGIIEGTWFRVEARFQCSTTTGNGEVRYFEEADSDAPTETLTFTNWNLGGPTSNFFAFGYTATATNLETMYQSGIALSNEDWIGPAPFKAKGVPGIQPNPIAIHTATW
jgi:hypothetical protein